MKLLYIFLIFLISGLTAQDGYWDAITPIKKIDKLVTFGGSIFGASRGGILKINPDQSVEFITRGNGLGGVITPDVISSPHGILAFNSSSILNYFDGSQWYNEQQIDLNEWMRIDADSSQAWISYKTGVIVYEFIDDNWQFRDFYNQFPENLSGTIYPVTFADKIFLFSTGNAISAPSDFHQFNLKNIDSWNHVDFWASDLTLYAFAKLDAKLYLATNKGLYEVDRNSNSTLLTPIPGGSTVNALYTDGDELFALGGAQIAKLNNATWISLANLPNTFKSFVKYGNQFILSDYYADIFYYDINSGVTTKLELQRPLGMRFRKFITTENGDLYAATTGFYGGSPDRAAYFKDGTWYDLRLADSVYTRYGYGNSIESVGISHRGEIIWSTYGRGIYIQRDVTDFQLINNSGNFTANFRINNISYLIDGDPAFNRYLAYVSTESDTTFVITQDMFTDQYGNVWITNYIANTFKSLICIKPDANGKISLEHKNWLYWDMRIPYSTSLNETSMGIVTVDPFDQVWIGSKYEGLAVLNYNSTLDNQSDDTWHVFRTTDGLESDQILSLGSDNNGTIFVGTDNGLNMISGFSVYRLKGEYAPLGARINGIVKDSKGNMWFATDIGISMLEADKNPFEPESWSHFDVDNSELLDNFCNGIYFDKYKNRLIIGTEKGISLFYTSFLINSENNSATLVIGPNPFHPRDQSKMVISGINSSSGLKILDATGHLIREYLPSEIKSGVVYWDGKNMFGEIVASGVYLFASSNDEGQFQTAKAVIIH